MLGFFNCQWDDCLRLFDIFYQNHNILDGGREIFLDLNSPQPSPAGTLKSKSDRKGKASLHEMLTCSYVFFGVEGLRPFTHELGFIMPEMAP